MTKPLIQQLASRAGISKTLLSDWLQFENIEVKLFFELCAYLDEQAAVVPERSALSELREVPGATSANAKTEDIEAYARRTYTGSVSCLCPTADRTCCGMCFGPRMLARLDGSRSALAASEARAQQLTGQLEVIHEQVAFNNEAHERLVRELTEENAEYEETIRELTGELAWEKAWDLHRKADMQAVVDAASKVREYLRAGASEAEVGEEFDKTVMPSLSALDARVEPVMEREIPGPIGAGDTVLCNFDTLKTLGKVVRVDNSAIPYLVEYETTELVRRETWADDRHLKRLIAADPAPPVGESAIPGGCYCSDFMPGGVPCPPNRVCPNAPKPVSESAPRKGR